MAGSMPKPAAYAVAIAAGILGPSSLLIFAAFLWSGSFGIFDLGAGGFATLVWDATLCFVFFLQHSGMIRRSFRNRLHRWLPDCYGGVVYTIASAAALLLLVGGWQRSSIEIYAVRGGGRWLLACILLPSLAGVLWGIRSLNNFDAFGIRQFLSGVRVPWRLSPLSRSKAPTVLFGTPSMRSG
jgi:hypothetical protein